MWTAAVLEARNQLQEDPVDAVTEARLVPVGVERVLLTLVENEGANVVVVDWVAWKVKVAVTQSLQYAEATTTAAAGQ